MRLIDADALMRIYQEVLCPHVSCADCSLLMNDGNCRFETMIRETIAIDAVPIVRCRECKHLMFSDCYGECGKGHMGIVSPNDFCSRGERKEGAE